MLAATTVLLAALVAPAEHVTAERVLLPIRVVPGREDPKGCLGLKPEEVLVFEDGVPVRKVEEVEQAWRPTVHLLLLDVSGSMRERLEFVRGAARAYVERLEPDEEAAILTLGDSLTLQAGPTSDRHVLSSAVDRVRLEGATPIWDAIEEISRQFGDHPARKALVAFTDGQDSGSLCTFAEAVGAASAVPDLSVFFVAPHPGEGVFEDPAVKASVRGMRDLARSTGGEAYLVDDPSRIGEAFMKVHAVLRTEAFVHYLPPDASDAAPLRADGFRSVRVRLAERREQCRVTHVKPDRYAGSAGGREGAVAVPKWKAVAAAGASRDPRCSEGAFVSARPGSAAGCTLDAIRDSGVLWDETRASLDARAQPALALRPFALTLPPIAELARTPGEALRRALIDDAPAALSGTAWLGLRARLAAAIDEGLPEYRAWLRASLVRRNRGEVERARRALVTRGYAPEAVEAEVNFRNFEGAARAESPGAVDRRDGLAAWLGDVDARDLTLEVDRMAIEDLLSGPEGARRAELVKARWSRLASWFPLPVSRRVVAMTSPVLDEGTGRIGFYRVVLPRPSWLAMRAGAGKRPKGDLPPDDTVPVRPFGLLVARRALEQPALRERLAAGKVRVERLEVGSGRDVPVRIDFRVGETGALVRVEATARPGADGGAEVTIAPPGA